MFGVVAKDVSKYFGRGRYMYHEGGARVMRHAGCTWRSTARPKSGQPAMPQISIITTAPTRITHELRVTEFLTGGLLYHFLDHDVETLGLSAAQSVVVTQHLSSSAAFQGVLPCFSQ